MKNSPIMKPIDISHLLLLTPEEQQMRIDRVRARMATDQLPAMLISDNANKYYLTGRVYAGYIYLPLEGPVIYFVRRPVELEGDGVVYIRKPEEIGQTVGAERSRSHRPRTGCAPLLYGHAPEERVPAERA